MTKKEKQMRNRKIGIYSFGAIAIIILIVGIALYTPLSPYYTGSTTTPTTGNSTISLLSYPDGEDVSNFVEISVWVPKSSAEFDEIEDIYTMSNFEEEEASKDAEDVSVDLSDYTYVWIEIDPDGESVFSNEFYLVYGGANYDYTMYVHQLTSDVNFNVFARDTLNEITVASYSTDSNLTLIFDCPHYTITNIHANSDDWEVDDDDWDELSASQQAEYYDEKNYRSQAVLYDPDVDTLKDGGDSDLSAITNALCFKFTFNDSISTIDAAVTQINITVADDDIPVEFVISGANIYAIYYETVSFVNGAQALGFEIEFGSQIELSDIDSGRIVLPRSSSSFGTFTKYSDIAA